MRLKNSQVIYILYCLYIINCIFSESQLVENSMMSLLLGGIRYGIIFLMVVMYIGKSNHSINRSMIIPVTVLFLAIVVNMVIENGGVGLLFLVVTIVNFYVYNINSEKLMKINIILLLLGHISVVVLSIVGVLEDRVNSRYVGNEIGKFFEGTYSRHTYGFLVQNQIPLALLIVYILRIVYKKKEMKIFEHIIFGALNFVFLFLFGSRISFIVLLLVQLSFFASTLISKKRGKKSQKRFCVFWMSYPICFAISLVSALKYDTGIYIWRYINNLFMNRIVMSHEAINTFGINLFGAGQKAINGFKVSGIQVVTIDSGYINLLVVRGVIITAVLIFLWSWLTYQAEKNKNFYVVFSLVSLAVLNLIDSHLASYKLLPFFCMMVEQYKMCHSKKPNGVMMSQRRIESLYGKV